ncbi:SDR family NAD(P)-dependent oxidoreductase [Saccharomonospora sp. NPDC046836]|uniref:SDR family NAD(P)-dependent oxidoreductase n=1 Tax=Saccharomonospora sp. NPDC046836 TaxID=3156921 RepID=UPI0034019489
MSTGAPPRVALVTGGASGIGAACAARLRADGVRSYTLDRDRNADLTADVTEEQAIRDVLAEIGPVDIVINSAGIVGPSLPFVDVSHDQWIRTLDVNLFGAVAVMRTFIPGMVERGWGRVVNIASIAGKDGNPKLAPYSASKGAMIAMTKSVGKELATTGVLVNAIAPAVITSPMNEATTPDVLAHVTDLIPMKRPGRAEEVAELAAWLASDKVSFSTGAVYDISGGRATY